MAGQIEICNTALSRIGSFDPIASLDHGVDSSKESRALALVWPGRVRFALACYAWPFASRRALLALLEEQPNPLWAYRYALPVDCVKPRYIEAVLRNATTEELVRWELEASADLRGTTLLTDEAEARLVYTTDQMPPEAYPPEFADYLSWLLAAEISIPLTMRPEVVSMCINSAKTAMLYARTAALNEGQPDLPREDAFTRSRY